MIIMIVIQSFSNQNEVGYRALVKAEKTPKQRKLEPAL